MIEVMYPFSAFASGSVDGGSLTQQIAASARLPRVLAVHTVAADCFVRFDAKTLTPAQLSTLNVVVADHDAPAGELLNVKAELDELVANHARTLNQSAGKTSRNVDTERDAVIANVNAAADQDAANQIAEAYLGRSL